MPTYRDAAKLAFSRLIQLTGDHSIYVNNNGFWHQGNALSTCVSYFLLNDPKDHKDHNQIVKTALDKVFDVYLADALDKPKEWTSRGRKEDPKPGPWLDDYGWWGIALQRAYKYSQDLGYDFELTPRILKVATDCWEALQGGWDASEVLPGISGGAWNHEKPSTLLGGRNCITNEALWLLSQRLHESVPREQRYVAQNKASRDWFAAAKGNNGKAGVLLGDHGLVLERLKGTKDQIPGWTWTGDQGMFIAACLGNQSAGGDDLSGLADTIGQAVTKYLLDGDGVIHDMPIPNYKVRHQFSLDYATGKGVFIRSWATWSKYQKAPANFQKLILDNAKAVWNNRLNKDAPPDPKDPTKQYQFGYNWNPKKKPYKLKDPKNPKSEPDPNSGEPDYPNNDNGDFSKLILQVSGMDALNAALMFAADEEIPQDG